MTLLLQCVYGGFTVNQNASASKRCDMFGQWDSTFIDNCATKVTGEFNDIMLAIENVSPIHKYYVHRLWLHILGHQIIIVKAKVI